MAVYDYNATLKLALVSDENGHRYEPMAELAEPVAEAPCYLLRQYHYVANAIAQGLVIIGKRIEMVPDQWERRAGRGPDGGRKSFYL